jgi:predicted permease
MSKSGPLDLIQQEIKHAVRLLVREKSFTIAAVLSLMLGIGANTAIFQLLDAIRLRTLPIDRPEQLAEIRVASGRGRTGTFNGRRPNLTFPQWDRIRADQQAFDDVFAWGSRRFNTSPAGEVHFIEGLFVSGNYFPALHVPPQIGRVFAERDDVRGCGPSGSVISYAYWQREFGGDPSVLSRTVSLDGSAFPIIGVTPPWFFGMEVGRMYDVAIPLCADDVFNGATSRRDQRDQWWLAVAGRLKDGWTVERATEQLSALSPRLFEATLPPSYGANDAKNYLAFRLNAFPAASGVSTLRTNFAEPLTVLLATTGLVLLIACANLANLLLARASARGREMAVRLAIGASRSRLVRQLMIESAVLALVGAVLGAALGSVLSEVLVGVLSEGNPAVFVDLSWNVRLFGFTAGVALVACLLFGIVPALRATAMSPGAALKAAGRGLTASRERFGLRRALVVTQVALSLVLLLGALLFTRTLFNLLTTNPGFNHQGAVIASVSHLSRTGRSATAGPEAQDVRRDLRDRIARLPDVVSVAQADIVPLGNNGFWNESVSVDGVAGERRMSNFNRVSAGFFRTLDIPVVAGRDFDSRDTLQSPAVAIVSQEFVKRFLAGGDPLGRIVRVAAAPGATEPTYQVVGVVRDTLLEGLRAEIAPMVYVASTQEQEPGNGTVFVIRPRGSVTAVMAGVKDIVAAASPSINIEFSLLSAAIRQSLLRERLMATLSTAFGVLAALLAAIGLYGVMSYAVARRANEIGIRLAIGAARGDVLKMVLREAALLIGAGLAAGAILAVLAGGAARTLLFGLRPDDPTTIAIAVAILGSIGLVAGFVPARRASRLDPSAALRDE